MRHTHRAGGRAGRVRSVQVPARQNARARAFACECVRGSLESIGSRGPRMTRIHHTIRHACMHNTLSSYLIRQLLAQQPCAHLNGLKKNRNNILIPPPPLSSSAYDMYNMNTHGTLLYKYRYIVELLRRHCAQGARSHDLSFFLEGRGKLYWS
jgi:hypothetical protein